jgi:hypothetical protein
MNGAAFSENAEAQSPFNPIRLAWGVIFVSFAVFCVVCAASVFGLHYFFFESSLSLDAVLHVGRGTVGVRSPSEVEQAESSERVLSRGILVRTDQTDLLSQAMISLHDSSYDNSLVASITLKSDTSVRLRSASRPRFQWSSPIYNSELDVMGNADILIPDDLERDVQIIIYTASGAEIRLESSGRYGITVSDMQVQVTNLHGEAVLVTVDKNEKIIVEDQKGILDIESGVITIEPTLIDLVTNGDLEPFSPEDATGHIPDQLVGWSCTNQSDGPPNGNYQVGVAPDGRPGFRLVRGDNADTNGKTKCVHTLKDIDVASYDYLAMQTTLYVSYQSLSRCGSQATECPLMLEISYVDQDGNGGVWLQGIYARDDADNNPLRIAGFSNNHIRIYDHVWYTYTSDNLIELLDRRPVIITDIVFYAEGHQYDVFVDEVRLLAGYTQSPGDGNSDNAGD